MGLSRCCNIVKYLLVLINVLFWIVGIAALALFIWVLTDPSLLISMTHEENHFYIGLYLFLVVGVLMLVISCLGCCGSLRESQCMLVSFFCFLLVVLVAEIAVGAWAFHNKEKLDSMVRTTVKHTIQNEYGIIDTKTAAFDTFQNHLECCGANGPNDWASSKYNNQEKKIINLEISSGNLIYNIPKSCCKKDVDEAMCHMYRNIPIASQINSDVIHLHGCTDKLVAVFHDNVTIVMIAIITIIVIELFGLIFSIMLCCNIQSNDYKA